MKILFVYFLFSFMAKCSDVEKREITFIVTVPDSLITDDTLYIAGSVEQLGNWQPNVVPLIRINTNKWQLNVELPLHEKIEYKFTRKEKLKKLSLLVFIMRQIALRNTPTQKKDGHICILSSMI